MSHIHKNSATQGQSISWSYQQSENPQVNNSKIIEREEREKIDQQ